MRFPFVVLCCLTLTCFGGERVEKEMVEGTVAKEMPSLLQIYQHLHAAPELSFHEEKTAARVAEELRNSGYDVATGIGRYGVVAVAKNGSGPTVLVRTDLDALPVKEQTGLPFASHVTARDTSGAEVPVMHACGHDIHMTCLIGVARVMAQIKDQWHGTLVLVGQPAEETISGARAMLKDGLFSRFPKPDVCLALHDKADLPAGTVGYLPGPVLASSDSVDILVRGVGGHGAWPHTTKDPVVLASEIVLALQTIVSREIEPGQAAVVTVGSIHGGTRHNIIPEEVRLELTVRAYSEEVRQTLLGSIRRIARGQGVSAGLPQDRLPVVTVTEESTPATVNDPQATERVAKALTLWLGTDKVQRVKPVMGAEDFAEFGRTADKIPICMFWVGGVKPQAYEEVMRSGNTLPSLHSGFWAPDAEPTVRTGITAMTAAVLEFLH